MSEEKALSNADCLRHGRRAGLVAACMAAAVLVAGCGGGGGDDTVDDAEPGAPSAGGADNAGPNARARPVRSPAVVITAANAQAIAADAFAATSATSGAQAGAAILLAVAAQGGLGSEAGPAGPVAASATFRCRRGGTLALSGTVNAAGAMQGDSLTITADRCRQPDLGTLFVMSGSISVSVLRGRFVPGPASYPQAIDLAIVVRSFRATDLGPGVTSTSDGDLAMTLVQTGPSSFYSRLAGRSLTNTFDGPDGGRVVTLHDYQGDQTIGTQVATRLTATVETTNPRIAARTVSYRLTTPDWVIRDLSLALGGVIHVVGQRSALRLEYAGAISNFHLKVDADGDGRFERRTRTNVPRLEEALPES